MPPAVQRPATPEEALTVLFTRLALIKDSKGNRLDTVHQDKIESEVRDGLICFYCKGEFAKPKNKFDLFSFFFHSLFETKRSAKKLETADGYWLGHFPNGGPHVKQITH
jgi:hypothetical protein